MQLLPSSNDKKSEIIQNPQKNLQRHQYLNIFFLGYMPDPYKKYPNQFIELSELSSIQTGRSKNILTCSAAATLCKRITRLSKNYQF